MRKRLFFKKRGEDGQAMVEFALVLPIFMLILCGILDFGWMFYNQLSLDNACREGARYAVVHSDVATVQIEQRIRSSCSRITGDDMEISVVFSNPSTPTDGDVNVTIVSEMRVLTPVMSAIVRGTTKTLVSTVVMKVEI